MGKIIDKIKYKISQVILEAITEPIIKYIEKKTSPLSDIQRKNTTILRSVDNLSDKIRDLSFLIKEVQYGIEVIPQKIKDDKIEEVYICYTKTGDFLPYAYTDKEEAMKQLKKSKSEINENTSLKTFKIKYGKSR